MAAAIDALGTFTPRPSRIRAVIADSDPLRRRLVRHSVLTARSYELVAEASNGEEFVQALERELPELAVCSDALALKYASTAGSWPVFITLGGARGEERVVCNVPLPCDDWDLGEALAAATARILQIKAAELASLVRNYLAYRDSRVERIEVEQADGSPVALDTRDILWIKAAGNYVQLFTRGRGTFELRDTISNIAEKLRPSGFLRIHRCAIVNASAIEEKNLNDGAITSVVLSDGTRLLVGPKYRDRLRRNRQPAEISGVVPTDI